MAHLHRKLAVTDLEELWEHGGAALRDAHRNEVRRSLRTDEKQKFGCAFRGISKVAAKL